MKNKISKSMISTKKSCKESFTKKKGFTLVEVLITLGIIGVVAAMTIPTLIANTQSQKFRSQFKKTISTLNQAVKMNIAQQEWDFSSVKGGSGEGMTLFTLFKNNLSVFSEGPVPYTEESKNSWNEDSDININEVYFYSSPTLESLEFYTGDLSSYILSDGSMISINNQQSFDLGDLSCTVPIDKSLFQAIEDSPSRLLGWDCVGYIDVNGKALPNKEVQCSNTTTAVSNDICIVDNKTMGDIFPIIMHDGIVEPLTNAGRYVLNTTK